MNEEFDRTIRLANRLLDEPYADPDDELRMLSRQFLRAVEREAPRHCHRVINGNAICGVTLNCHLHDWRAAAPTTAQSNAVQPSETLPSKES